VTPERFRQRLEQSDLLFLGLSFNTAYPDVIRTASPAKLPEYMASGRPILIHAPEGSHVARYGREGGFCEVVDVADDDELQAGIVRVLSDPQLAEERAVRAQELARQVHEVSRVRERFSRLLESVSREAGD
jgi:glycosyltransferase involved in cell wall biosynthesis